MRVHVALTPAEFEACDLPERAVVVVDVMRATTTVVAGCAAGCRRVIPVADPASARARAARCAPGEALLAGERGGDPVPGFDLGNSPLEYTPDRVRGRTIILVTTNGTAAMLAARRAAAAAVGALTNVEAAARWARDQGRDLTILCSGDHGSFSLEDGVCAGLLVERIEAEGRLQATDAAVAARRLAQHYAPRLDRLREDSAWARHLARSGRAADLEACLTLAALDQVPVFEGEAILPRVRGAILPAAGGRSGPEPRR